MMKKRLGSNGEMSLDSDGKALTFWVHRGEEGEGKMTAHDVFSWPGRGGEISSPVGLPFRGLMRGNAKIKQIDLLILLKEAWLLPFFKDMDSKNSTQREEHLSELLKGLPSSVKIRSPGAM